MPYSSVSEQHFQEQIHEWHNAYRWIQDCPPHTSCKTGLGFHCTSDFCYRHGQYQRIEKANRILSLGEPTSDAYALTLPYGTALTPHQVAQARKHFLKSLLYRCPQIGCLWRLHFLKFVPHLNLTIMVNTNCSKVNPIQANLIKPIWSDSLTLIGHPKPDGERVYCRHVETYAAWVRYMFQTGKKLRANEVPPKVPYSRWGIWGMNKAYRNYLSHALVQVSEASGESACSVGQRSDPARSVKQAERLPTA